VDLAIGQGASPEAVAELLSGLPEWFGIEQSNLDYIDAARTLPGVSATSRGAVVAVCLLRRHNPQSAEIEFLAVRRDHHRRGVGRRVVAYVEAELGAEGVTLLQVKTFGPSGDSPEYERTRAFYESVGFVPLEERHDIWGPDNPCLIYVKPIG
jgi:GNAT superfamily N-acetyltransferase